jgi:hypothetical protein
MRERIDEFSIDRQGALIRNVVPARGEPYRHRCTLAAFEAVAHAIDEAGEAGFTLEEIAAREDLPSTQVAVATAFLKERGAIITERRRSYPASGSVHLDAMVEFHALRERAT